MYDIILVDDSAEIRTGLSLKLDWKAYGFRIGMEASNGEEALALLHDRRVSVVVTDIRMPIMDGLALLSECAARYPATKTIVLSGYDDFPLVRTALRQGAKDYLLKPVLKDELIAVLVKIKKELDEERETILCKIAHEQLPLSEAQLQLSTYGLAEWGAPDAAVLFVTAEIRLPASRVEDMRQDRSNSPSAGAFKHAFHLLASEVAAPWGDSTAVFHDEHQPERVYFIMRQSSATSETDERIARFVQSLTETTTRYLRLELVVGIGHAVSGVDQWHVGLASSLASLNRSKPEAISQAIYDNGRDINREMMLPAAAVRKFTAAIEKMSVPHMRQALDEIAQIGKRSSVQSYSFFLVQLCLALDEWIHKHDLKHLELQPMLWPYINAEWRYESFDQRLDGIRSMAERVIETLQSSKGKGREETIAAICEHIHKYYGEEELSLASIANQHHYNAAYLSDLFRKTTGSTFSDYVLQVRMNNASRMLRDGGLKIADIAQLTGFSSAAYFSNVFKGYFGSGPNEYRKSTLTAEN
ncbi:response regulator transcription factor [Cohnella soli]|uniref:Response regulator n=1 Tax=Cohnella soli TaxID=425005 RepID=A0ABW0I3Q1_9BACL